MKEQKRINMAKIENKVKIRQPLVENPKWNFEYPKEQKAIPRGTFMSFEEANEKHKIEGGQLEHFVEHTYVLEGDVYIQNEEQAEEIIKIAMREDENTLIIITGNLFFKGWLEAPFAPLMVCGDAYCDVVVTGDENDTTIKGNIYAKYAFWLCGGDSCFECMGKVFTPYFFTGGDDVNISIKLAKGYIGIDDDKDVFDSEMGYKTHYKAKHHKTSFAYEVLDQSFELSIHQFIDFVASGNNPILEFKRTKKEIATDKKRKLDGSFAEIIKNADKELELKGLKLKEIPESVFEKTDLEILNLASNRIKKLPPEIANLKKLKKLNLRGNNAINLDAVCELENLEILNINNCALAWKSEEIFYLPKEFGRLKNLKTLFVEGGVTFFANPERIADLENLENLQVDYRLLLSISEDYIPQIKDMKSLKRLIVFEDFYDKKDIEIIKNTYPNCEILFWEERQCYFPNPPRTFNFKDLKSLKDLELKAKTNDDYKKVLECVNIFYDK